MSMFGLREAEVAELVRAVSPDGPDREAIADRFARAAWTGLAEPGDRIAGALVAALGAVRALEGVVEGRPAAALADAVPELREAELREALARWSPRLRSADALLALRQAARFGARLRVPSEPDWPGGLADLGDHGPLALWTRGTDEAYGALGQSIALVGARAATGYGEHMTMQASAGLVDRGYTIVSGAAYGIDGMAHRAALASHGRTVAFLAGGVDRFYPAGHEALLNRIVESGTVVSEVPPGAAPTRWRFLQRNRLIAAVSLATVVLEAGSRSGSLNTAGHATQIGRPVGAVPGPVTSAASAGCHRLIREYAAMLVTTADEMAELAPLGVPPSATEAATGTEAATREATAETNGRASGDPDGTRVLDALSRRSPRRSGDVAARAGLSLADVQSVLGRLQLDGLVREAEGGWLRPAPRV